MEMELPTNLFSSSDSHNSSSTTTPIFRYTPSKSSPLSTRSSNRDATFTFSSPPPQMKLSFFPLSPPRSPPSQRVLAAKRKFRPNPLMRPPEESRERRRNLFLKKLRENREEKIIQSRGGEEEMMRMIFVAEKKRWDNMYERAASNLGMAQISPEEEEAEIMAMMEQSSQDVLLAEQMLAEEDGELDALLLSSQMDTAEDNEMMDAPIFESHSINAKSQNGAHNQSESLCQCCGGDSLVDMPNEIVCFDCGWSTTTTS